MLTGAQQHLKHITKTERESKWINNQYHFNIGTKYLVNLRVLLQPWKMCWLSWKQPYSGLVVSGEHSPARLQQSILFETSRQYKGKFVPTTGG